MCKTLIVEDNAGFRETLRDLLSSRFPDMLFEESEGGKEVMDKISIFSPDFVFVDIKLKGENGLELTKKIKATYSRAIVIILTAHDLPEYRQAAKENGANHFLSKDSSTAGEIWAVMESCLSHLRLRRHPEIPDNCC
jgi:DNA-binding NarL/FixJ family response regulator